ncbi:MAG: MFS transporter [archaeon]
MNINKVIWILILSDLMFNAAMGFLNPVFSIFIVRSVAGGTATVAGIAMAIVWLIKSTFRIPIGYFLDKIKGEKDDFYSMIIGFLIFSIAHFLYLFASVPIHIYGIQFLMGLAGAFAFTPWYGLFSRHLDRHHENFEWGIAISLTGFGLAAASFTTGLIADTYGFAPIFIISGTVSLIGTVLLLTMRKHLKVKMEKGRYHIKVKKN